MLHQLAAERRAEHPVRPVRRPRAAQLGQHRAAARTEHQQRRPGSGHLCRGGGQQPVRRRGGEPEHGRDLGRSEPVTHRQFQGLPLLRTGARRLRPGQRGQLAPLLRGEHGTRRGPQRCRGARRHREPLRRGLLRVGPVLQPPQAAVPRQSVQPGPQQAGLGEPLAVAQGQVADLPYGGDGRVVPAQDGEAVGEQAVDALVVRLEDRGAGRWWGSKPGGHGADARETGAALPVDPGRCTSFG
ncbi:hypothetical protein ACFC1R_17525 [Kitasatospora sp. NPDC056138]|uniref:hypothetical protein n=1 Tax=Kitasatospora sp. NPDC056138 TaxID=3345724 RepID=UPI0035D9E34B